MMKKTIMTIMLALAALLPMQAQTITGNWIAAEEDEDAGIAYILAFEGNLVRQCVMAGTEMEGVGDVTLVIAVPAQNYTPNSKTINFTFDGSKAEVVVKDIDFIDAIKAVIKDDAQKKEELLKTVQVAFEQKKVELANNMLLSGVHTITKATADKLELKDTDGETYVFCRLQ